MKTTTRPKLLRWFVPALALLVAASSLSSIAAGNTRAGQRSPATPLVACDPYFSIWSPADALNGSGTVHWTGKPHRLTGLVRIDGQTWRFMGAEPGSVPPLPQTELQLLPTKSVYTFMGGGVCLKVCFMTPALPDDLMVYSRPVTYITFEPCSTDGEPHSVQIYFDAAAEIAVNKPDQLVAWKQVQIAGLSAARIGSVEQPVLAKRGDDLRIDWGYLYLAAEKGKASIVTATSANSWQAFASGQEPARIPAGNGAIAENSPVLAAVMDCGKVSKRATARTLVLAYDDEFSIQYFKTNLRPYWRKNGDDAAALLRKSVSEYGKIAKRCDRFDAELVKDVAQAGGADYARLCALAYRQCHAANKLVADANGQPLLFPKENFSNGCIGTVDILYPMAPQFLLLSPSLTKAMLVPIMDYSASPRWRWPFAPHDLGTYPLANGQVYGGGERTEENQMPVEETGNMLVLMAALAKSEGNVDFSRHYWPVLEKWARFLEQKGFDPENQLCTDDFAGHLAHNVNLSAKAICGLGAYAQLCAANGMKAESERYNRIAREFAARWIKDAADGDHYKLAFDRPGTWSQKYNLVWDKILGLNLFPSEVLAKEMAFYKKSLNRYGLPLDSRKDYTKLDWTLWAACLTQDPDDFKTLLAPVVKFLQETPDRVPMTDWYDTKTGKMVGFRARSVVGGVFLRMLYSESSWRKWAAKDRTHSSGWAPMPKPPETISLVPTAEAAAVTWKYTTQRPADDWSKAAFDDSGWKVAQGGFGTANTPGAVVRTKWDTSDIWLRRDFEMPATKMTNIQLRVHHDEDAEIYINGVEAGKVSGFSTDYEVYPMRSGAQEALKPGKNVMAVHCHQTSGGQYVDVGLVDVKVRK